MAALAHLSGGGAAPGVLGLALAAAFAVPASALLAGRTVSTVRLAASVVISQGAFHALLSFGAASTAVVRVTGGHHDPTVHAMASVPAGAHAALPDMHAGPGMWVAHAAAAAATALALRHGERALWDLVRLARAGIRALRLRVPASVPPRGPRHHRVASAAHVAPRDLDLLLIGAPRRGPPGTAPSLPAGRSSSVRAGRPRRPSRRRRSRRRPNACTT